MLHHLPRILIIDDNPVNCEICSEILENDYEVMTIESGEEGLKVVPEFEPDLILLDVMMPGMDGLEVCRQLRTSARSWVKIIMVSAKGQVKDRIAGYDAGADDYITKPFDEEELLAKIRVHLRLKHVEEIDSVKCRLLQVLQHGNRTSMAHILMNSDILSSMYDKLNEDERRARLKAVQRGAICLHSWLATGEQLLALLTGQYNFCPEKIDINRRLTRVWKQVCKRDGIANDRVQFVVAGGLKADCDKEFFDLLVDRLLCDAVTASSPETPITLKIEASDPERLRISINRGSEAIPSELLPKMLEPFGVPDEVMHNLGDGMSLAVVREIARVHSGLVRAKTAQSGLGVDICVELPVTQNPILSTSTPLNEQGVV